RALDPQLEARPRREIERELTRDRSGAAHDGRAAKEGLGPELGQLQSTRTRRDGRHRACPKPRRAVAPKQGQARALRQLYRQRAIEGLGLIERRQERKGRDGDEVEGALGAGEAVEAALQL